MNTEKQMYVAPNIMEHVIELEQGIAAASVGNVAPGTVTTNDYQEGQGNQGWEVDAF